MRQTALTSILDIIRAVRPQTTVAEIQKKWNGLRSTYIAEKKKVDDSTRSGSGVEDVSNKLIFKTL